LSTVDLNNVTTILFDLGGVILDLDMQRTFDRFAELAQMSLEEITHKISTDPVFGRFERGMISSEEFRDHLSGVIGDEVSITELDKAWCAMLMGLPRLRLETINNLRPAYTTAVLSNTNAIHVNEFNKIVEKEFPGDSFNKFFDKVYYSHQLHLSKPDPVIYEVVLNDLEKQPNEVLFIDDTYENIESANRMGMRTWHLTNQADLIPNLIND